MSKRILIFESDSAFAGSVSRRLTRSGITVDVVEDGNRGCELAVQTKPDLILLTIELPQMNGFLVCKKLKKAPESAAIPIIILSAEATDEIFEAHRNLRTRADVYLKKPVEIPVLIEKIRAFVPVSDGDPSELSLHDLEAIENPGSTEIVQPHHDLGEWIEPGARTGLVQPPAFPPEDARTGLVSAPAKVVSRSFPPPKEATGQHRIDGPRSEANDLLGGATGIRAAAERRPSLMGISSSGDLMGAGIPSQAPKGREYLELRESVNRKEREVLDLKDQVRDRDRQILDLRDRSIRLERELADEQAGQLVLERELDALREAHAAYALDRDAWIAKLEASEEAAGQHTARIQKLEHDLESADSTSRRVTAKLEQQLASQTELLEQQRVAAAEDARRLRAELEAQKQAHLEESQQRATAFDSLRATALADLEAQWTRSSGEALENQKLELERKHQGEIAMLEKRLGEVSKDLAFSSSRMQEVDAELVRARTQLTTADQRASQLGERASELEGRIERMQQKMQIDEQLLERVRKALAIGSSLLEEQKNV